MIDSTPPTTGSLDSYDYYDSKYKINLRTKSSQSPKSYKSQFRQCIFQARIFIDIHRKKSPNKAKGNKEMQTLMIQIQNDGDYQLFLSLANRLNCKVITKPRLEEEWHITDEMKSELDARLLEHEKNPEEGFSMADVKKELEVRLGRKIQVKARG